MKSIHTSVVYNVANTRSLSWCLVIFLVPVLGIDLSIIDMDSPGSFDVERDRSWEFTGSTTARPLQRLKKPDQCCAVRESFCSEPGV